MIPIPFHRILATCAILLALVGLPFKVRAQLSTREQGEMTVYRAQSGGVPYPLATWLESDVDERPAYPGGATALTAHFRTTLVCDTGPVDVACNSDLTVLVWFIVEQDGGVREAWIDRGGCEVLQQRTICYVLNMPPWTPGRRDGHPVRTRVRVPVHYSPH